MELVNDTQTDLRRRAYKLARSGECKSLIEISSELIVEGYSTSSIEDILQENTRAELARIIIAADRM